MTSAPSRRVAPNDPWRALEDAIAERLEARFAENLAEIRALRAEVALLRRPPDGSPVPCAADVVLANEILRLGNVAFVTADLLDHARVVEDDRLRVALTNACGLMGDEKDGRRVGAWLSRFAKNDSDLDGIRIRRLAVKPRHGAAVWQAVVVGSY